MSGKMDPGYLLEILLLYLCSFAVAMIPQNLRDELIKIRFKIAEGSP